MLNDDNRDDTAAVLVDPSGPPVANGKIVDEIDSKGQPTGFKLFVPTEEEKARMEARVDEEADLCERAYEPMWARMRENIDAYEGIPDKSRDDFMTLPYGKRDVNHLVGFFVNRIYNKNPLCSIIPEEYGDYEVPVPVGVDPMSGQTMSRVEIRTADELAEGGERLMEHYLRGPKLKFREFLYTLIMSAVQGAPGWGKTCYERVLRPQLVPKWTRSASGMVVASGYTEVDRVVGSPHKLVAQSGFNVMMADPWLDPQEAEMMFEHVPHTIGEGRNKVNQNEWYLCTDDDWEEMRKAVGDLKKYEDNGSRDEQRKSDRPRHFLDVFNVPLYWPIIFADEDGQDVEGIFSLSVQWERTTKKILACPLNPYAHGRRNLVPYVQRPRPFEMSAFSTMEDVLPLQKVGTRLWHSQIQNAMLANTVFVKYRPGSTAAGWLKNNEVRAKSKIPVQNDNDFKSDVLGRELRSLAPEMSAVDAMSKQLTVSDTVKGTTLLGRTSRAAISLVQEAGLTVPNMDLDFLRDRLSEQLTMFYQNLGQWSSYGEEIPFRDPVTRATVMKAVEFPLEGNTQFTVRITASSDEETAQFEFERNLGLAKLQDERNRAAAEILAPMLNPQAPPVVRRFQQPMLEAHYALDARIFELAKLDPKKFALSPRDIEEILAEHDQWVAAEKQRQMEEQIAIQAEAIRRANAGGGGAVVQGAFGGGAVPGPGGQAVPPGPPGVAQQPGNAPGPPPPTA